MNYIHYYLHMIQNIMNYIYGLFINDSKHHELYLWFIHPWNYIHNLFIHDLITTRIIFIICSYMEFTFKSFIYDLITS